MKGVEINKDGVEEWERERCHVHWEERIRMG